MAHDDSILSDALVEALAQVVSEVRREWLQELEILRAERRALVADLRLIAAGMAPPSPDTALAPAKPASPAKTAKPRART